MIPTYTIMTTMVPISVSVRRPRGRGSPFFCGFVIPVSSSRIEPLMVSIPSLSGFLASFSLQASNQARNIPANSILQQLTARIGLEAFFAYDLPIFALMERAISRPDDDFDTS